jgi:hypothetical protein
MGIDHLDQALEVKDAAPVIIGALLRLPCLNEVTR